MKQNDLTSMHDIDELLEERGSQYGSFGNQVGAITTIMNQLRELRYQDVAMAKLLDEQDTLNFFLVLKLCRMQTSRDSDSARDLIGYAKLILNEREKEQE